MQTYDGITFRPFALRVIVLASFAAAAMAFTVAANAADTSVGRKIAPFTLKDYHGKEHSLAALLSTKKAVAVVFLGTECPLAKLYGPRMKSLSKEFEAKGVAFLAIDSNRQDAVVGMEAFARQQGLTFPFLKDLSNRVADDFGATPHARGFSCRCSGRHSLSGAD